MSVLTSLWTWGKRGQPHTLLLAMLLSIFPCTWGVAADAAAELDLARAEVDAGSPASALAIVSAILDEDPRDPAALLLRAEIYRRLDRLEEARTDYAALSAISPEEPVPWFWLGTLHRWSGRHAEALSAYSRCLEISPCDGGALKGRARVHALRGDTAAELQDLQHAVECAVVDTEAVQMLALALSATGDRTAAEQLLREHLNGAELPRSLGELAQAEGRPAAAARQYRQALSIDSTDPRLFLALGDAERLAGRTQAALEAYRGALAIDPEETGALYWIGVLETRSGSFKASLEAFDGILVKDPDDAGALIGKARLYRADGRVAQALEIAEQVLRADPENAEARTLRASILGAAGRREEARRELRRVLDAHPEDTDACTAMDQLGPRRYFGFDGFYDESNVIEGLEGQGLEVNGEEIVPTRIRYLGHGLGAQYGQELSEGHQLRADLHWGREAVINLDAGSDVYDFDVFRGSTGLDHRLNDHMRFNWRLGSVRYDSRAAGSISADDLVEGEAELELFSLKSRLAARYSRSAFIQRGFAADFQFRIFERDRLVLFYDRLLRGSYFIGAEAGRAEFDDGNSIEHAVFRLGWQRGNSGWILRLSHDPFPARFLTVPDRNLEFVDYTSASIRGWHPLPGGFGISGELLAGRYGKTAPLIAIDTDFDGIPDTQIEEAPEHNLRQLFRGDLYWTATAFEPLLLGVGYLVDDFDFRTGPYNTNNSATWFLYVQLADELVGRWSYAVRYSRLLNDDDRDPDYASNRVSARVERLVGCRARKAGTLRFGLEGRYDDNELDEDRHYLRAFLRMPF